MRKDFAFAVIMLFFSSISFATGTSDTSIIQSLESKSAYADDAKNETVIRKLEGEYSLFAQYADGEKILNKQACTDIYACPPNFLAISEDHLTIEDSGNDDECLQLGITFSISAIYSTNDDIPPLQPRIDGNKSDRLDFLQINCDLYQYGDPEGGACDPASGETCDPVDDDADSPYLEKNKSIPYLFTRLSDKYLMLSWVFHSKFKHAIYQKAGDERYSAPPSFVDTPAVKPGFGTATNQSTKIVRPAPAASSP